MRTPIKVVILHYHLQRGGVTTVIGNACRALAAENISACVIVGEKPPPDCGLNGTTLPELAYGAECEDIDDFYSRLKAAARQLLGGEPDIWHIHNHSLGKNHVLPRLPSKLADEGERVILQPHDFAEDYRPANYSQLRATLKAGDFERLYPHSARVHYALLNRRDLKFLRNAGIAPERLHMLPNAVEPFCAHRPIADEDSKGERPPLILYPTRAIRRKNIGELLFWAATLKGRARFGLTLAPQNPRERPLYDRWVAFARKLDLPIEFELGARCDLPNLVAASRAVITTSLAEGFGLAFLEPWTAGRPVIGRRLVEITDDFTGMGIDLSACYDSLDVPLEWLGRKRVLDQIAAARARMLRMYGIAPQTQDMEKVADSVQHGDKIDFGRLGEALQREAIAFAARQSAGFDPDQLLNALPARNAIDANNEAIMRSLSMNRYAERLQNIYSRLMSAPLATPEFMDPQGLLELFLQPARFRMLLTEQSLDERGAQ